MELEKRKREDERQVRGKREKPPEKEDSTVKPPEDDEVEQFFAIMKRIQAAVKYFQNKRNDGRKTAAAVPWTPSFEREDFDPISPTGSSIYAGLDLNAHPPCDSL